MISYFSFLCKLYCQIQVKLSGVKFYTSTHYENTVYNVEQQEHQAPVQIIPWYQLTKYQSDLWLNTEFVMHLTHSVSSTFKVDVESSTKVV